MIWPCVYALSAIDGAVKIGTSTRLSRRIQELKSKHGPLSVVGVLHAASRKDGHHQERRAHHMMRAWCRGGEWFDFNRFARRLFNAWTLPLEQRLRVEAEILMACESVLDKRMMDAITPEERSKVRKRRRERSESRDERLARFVSELEAV